MICILPPELHVQTFTYLRATDLSSLQQTCQAFNDRHMIQSIIDNFSQHVYPPELTNGYDTPAVGGEVNILRDATDHQFKTYEALRNMEMLVVARILSRPEPPLSQRSVANGGYYYVSKSWCRTALKWLDFQAETRKHMEQNRLDEVEAAQAAAAAASVSASGKKGKKHQHHQKSRQKKIKNQQRKSKKKNLTKTQPPPNPNLNVDITCEHGCLQYCGAGVNRSSSSGNTNGGGRSFRAKRRLMDKQAWKVLKALYPQGVQLSALDGECIQCKLEAETERKNEEMKKSKETEERKKPLQDPLVRGIYSRRSGVPKSSLVFQPNNAGDDSSSRDQYASTAAKKLPPPLANGATCPLVNGVYNVVPRAWCHQWRKWIKTGSSRPPAPDTSACLCDAHRLPLIPPHLLKFLHGETMSLMDTSSSMRVRSSSFGHTDSNAVGYYNDSIESPQATRALPVGFYPLEQRLGGSGPRTPSAAAAMSPRTPIPPRNAEAASVLSSSPVANSPLDDELTSTLRASGLSEAEIQLQKFAMLQIEEKRARQLEEEQRRQRARVEAVERRRQAVARAQASAAFSSNDTPLSPEEARAKVNAQLDRENKVVVEILTNEELMALEKWWPNHSSYAMKFAVVESGFGTTEIVWTTEPCGECDASTRSDEHSLAVRNRNRAWVNNTPKKRFK